MKSIIAKAALAIGIGLVTGTSAAYAGPAPRTADPANEPHQETAIGRVVHTVVYSPVIAWEVMRGERPLFPHETAMGNQGGQEHRKGIALTGHTKGTKSQTETKMPTHYDPPI